MATYYWVGGSGTWDSTSKTNWATSSGGAGGNGPPTNADSVIFDTNSGTTATVSVASTAVSLNVTVNKSDLILRLTGNATLGINAGIFTLTSGTVDVNSNVLTVAIFQSTGTNARTIAFGDTGKIAVTGSNSPGLWFVSNINATLTGSRLVEFTYSGGVGTRNIKHGYSVVYSEANSINVNITGGTDTVVFSVDGNCALNNVNFSGFKGTFNFGFASQIYGDLTLDSGSTSANTSTTVTFASTSGTKQITTNSVTLNFPITFNGIGGTSAFQDTLTQNTSKNFTLTNGTVQLKNGVTHTVGTFATSGTNRKYLQSTLAGSQASLSQASGTVNAQYLDAKDIAAVGGARWNLVNASVNRGNLSGWYVAHQQNAYYPGGMF